MARGSAVKRGDKLGKVGKLVGIKGPSDMLHLEMYETTAAGALTVKGNPPFQRRKDMIDPTLSIDKAVFE